jgi:uncharacterized protein
MNQPAKAQEPSMEEILASIRRIIADDDSNKPAAKAGEPAAAGNRSAPPAAGDAPPAPANKQGDIDAMLAELDVEPSAPPSHESPNEAGEPPSDVLDLTEAMAAPSPESPPPPKPSAAPAFRTIDSSSDVVFSEPAPERPRAAEDISPTAERPQRPFAQPSRPMPERPLISQTTVAAIDSAFNSLAHTVIGQNARTLEDLVKEMLRPLLKSWLDDNLPGVVDRIVRAEIERVSRGR